MCRYTLCSSSLAETWHTNFPRGELAAGEAAAWRAAQHQCLATLIPCLPELRGGQGQHFSDSLGFGWEKLRAELLTVQEICVVDYGGGGGFYPGVSLSFPCNRREGQRFFCCTAAPLSLQASPWSWLWAKYLCRDDSQGGCCKGMVGPCRTFQCLKS